MARKRNEHAFPFANIDGSAGSKGLTKRELFACVCMNAILGNTRNESYREALLLSAVRDGEDISAGIALLSIETADALIAALAKEVV